MVVLFCLISCLFAVGCRCFIFYFFYAACTFNWYIMSSALLIHSVLYRCWKDAHTIFAYTLTCILCIHTRIHIYPPHYYLLPYRHLIRTSLRCTHSVRSGGIKSYDSCTDTFIFSLSFFLLLLMRNSERTGTNPVVYSTFAGW